MKGQGSITIKQNKQKNASFPYTPLNRKNKPKQKLAKAGAIFSTAEVLNLLKVMEKQLTETRAIRILKAKMGNNLK